MSTTISASGLELAEACDGAHSLAQVRRPSDAYQTKGTAIHAYLEAALAGDPQALARVPDEHRAVCAGIDLARLFPEGSRVLTEAPLAYDPVTDSARVLGPGPHRSYPGLRAGEVPGTVDAIETWGEPVERVRITDHKSGWLRVEPDSFQLAVYGLMVARLFGVESIDLRIAQIDEAGAMVLKERTLDAFDLLTVAGRVSRILERVADARALVARGGMPSVVMGEWCTWCCAQTACPAQAGLARTVLAELTADSVQALLAGASAEQVGIWWEKLSHVAPLVEEMQRGLKALVDQYQEVPLPDGRRVVSKESSVRSVNAKVALPILREVLGPKADDLVSTRVTLTDIEAAGGKELMVRMKQAGAVHEKTIVRHTVVGKARAVG